MFDKIYDVLLNPGALIIAAAVFALFGYAIRVMPKLVQWKHWKRIQPLAAMVVGCAAAVIPGVVDGDEVTIGYKLLFGVWAGFIGLVAVGARSLIKKFIVKKMEKKLAESEEESMF